MTTSHVGGVWVGAVLELAQLVSGPGVLLVEQLILVVDVVRVLAQHEVAGTQQQSAHNGDCKTPADREV